MAQYEMAYRMQQSAPEIADLSDEPQYILDMYGPEVQRPGSFARNCLIARRLAERDVKYIAMHNIGWDHHTNIAQRHPPDCRSVDQASAALVKDLKQRGLLEDTLVIWGSEFGRTPFAQGALDSNMGRDHHGSNFTYWLAGAGVKPAFAYGRTDDFSCNVVEHPVTIHDFHATLLHILGIDHERLTFHFQGRNFRLTDVHGLILKDILA
jgi:membrane-anchored protein YejM (alkaline phosphatase superfamily)